MTIAVASLWASMAAWFTPTILFFATNLIIATIFIASNNNNNKHHDPAAHGDHHHSLSRVSSFLDRARSMKLSSYSTTITTGESQHLQYPSQPETATYTSSSRLAQSIHSSSDHYVTPPETQPLSQLVRAPSFLDRVKSFRLSTPTATSTQPETVDINLDHHVIRSKSEKAPVRKSLPEMKKSRSEMRMTESDDEEEEVDLRWPATARERKVEEEVDARADDFISRFKQQLKLQRLESLVRYKEMLNRSS